MRSISKLLVLGISFLSLVAQDSRRSAADQQRNALTLTRIYTGTDGQTHAEDVDPKLVPVAGRAGVEQSKMISTTGLTFIRRAPGVTETWHPAPRRQYAITLSGIGELEVVGKKIRLEPGNVLLIEDVTGKGHLTRVLGAEDWVSVLIPLAN